MLVYQRVFQPVGADGGMNILLKGDQYAVYLLEV